MLALLNVHPVESIIIQQGRRLLNWGLAPFAVAMIQKQDWSNLRQDQKWPCLKGLKSISALVEESILPSSPQIITDRH